jgi:hypothetical protein
VRDARAGNITDYRYAWPSLYGEQDISRRMEIGSVAIMIFEGRSIHVTHPQSLIFMKPVMLRRALRRQGCWPGYDDEMVILANKPSVPVPPMDVYFNPGLARPRL